MEEFSCPSCRSNLYDPFSGCLSCGTGRIKGASLSTGTNQAPSQSQYRSEAERRKYVAEWAERAKQRKLAKEEKQKKQRKKLLAEEQRKKEQDRIFKEKQREEKRQRSQFKVSHVRRSEKILTKADRRKERLERLAESRRAYTKGGLKGLLQFVNTSITCPFCGSTITTEEAYKHFNKAHSPQISSEDRMFLENAKTTRRLSVPDLERMYELLKQDEPLKLQNDKAAEQSPVGQTYASVTKESFQQSLYDERDASRSYAHRFRENGRFGSHPLHDDYDDESFPD